MTDGKFGAKSQVMIAVITAISAVIVAWITAGASARSATETKIQESGSILTQLTDDAERLQNVRLEGLPVGSIIASLLAPGEFARQVGDPYVFNPSVTVWVLADGAKELTGSSYWEITRSNRLPDLRGLFLRGINEGRSDGSQDPDGERKPGDTQSDELKSHSHPLSQNVGRSEGWSGGWGSQSSVRAVNGPMTSADARAWGMKVNDFGGQETRPRNAAVYYYVKINASSSSP